MMGDAEQRKYEEHMNGLVVCCQILEQIDLEWCAATITHTHAVGPILMPTEYRDGLADLRDQEKLICAARELQRVAREVSSPG